MRVEDLEDAFGRRHRLLQRGVDAAQFLDWRVHHERGRDEGGEVAFRQRLVGDLTAAVPDQADDRDAAEQFHERRQQRERARHFQVRSIQPLRRQAETLLLVTLGAECLHDSVSGEGLSGHVGELLEVLLAPSRRAPDALAEADERIDDKRRAGDRHQREPRVQVEQIDGEPHERQPFTQQIADRLGDRLLHLVDVVRNPRHELTARVTAEERRGLIEDVAEQPIAQVADHPLTDVGHHERRRVARRVP